MSEQVKRYTIRAGMPETAALFLPPVVVSASDYDALAQRCRELETENADLQSGIMAASHFAEGANTLRAEVEQLQETNRQLMNPIVRSKMLEPAPQITMQCGAALGQSEWTCPHCKRHNPICGDCASILNPDSSAVKVPRELLRELADIADSMQCFDARDDAMDLLDKELEA